MFARAQSPLGKNPTGRMKEAWLKASAGERLNREEAEALYYDASLLILADLAHAARKRLHPGDEASFVALGNINYSNVCVCGCRFCAFFRPPAHPEAHVASKEEIAPKIGEVVRLGGTQIRLQGGHNPDLPFEWYEDLLGWIKGAWPSLHIQAFSPSEICYWSRLYRLASLEILQRLRKAGLDSISGYGAEILQNDVRRRVSPNKCTAEQWLMVMEEAHSLGIKSTATMMFGHEEKPGHRLDHIFALRELQDRTGGFITFTPWTFQPANSRIRAAPLPSPAYLRLLAISRLALDNISNIQASWVSMGPEIAQLALFYGANEFGPLMIEENMKETLCLPFHMSREEIIQAIKNAGFTPRQIRFGAERHD